MSTFKKARIFIRNNAWSDTDGNRHRQTNIVVTKLEFLDKKITTNEANDDSAPISSEQHIANIKAILGDEPLEESVPF